jgi:opacity protein-like surface antigen
VLAQTRMLTAQLCAAAAVAAACSTEASQSSENKRADPPPRPVASAPQVIDRNGAVSGAAHGGDTPEATAEKSNKAKALLRPAAKGPLQGEARLQDVEQGVHVSVHVRGAEAGAARVALRGSGLCDERPAKESASNTVRGENRAGRRLCADRSGLKVLSGSER